MSAYCCIKLDLFINISLVVLELPYMYWETGRRTGIERNRERERERVKERDRQTQMLGRTQLF